MERLKSKTIGVRMGGLSSERDVSLETGKAVFQAIQQKGLNVLAIDVNEQIASTLVYEKIDLAFIALHGTYGEDGAVQGLLEYAKIPYTGSGLLASAVAFNKVMSKELFRFHGIPTADYQVFYKDQGENVQRTLDLPVVVKPSDQGSSIGVTIVREEAQWQEAVAHAFAHSDEILAEQYIEGKLLAIGICGSRSLPIVHIIPKSEFYDYEAKYTPGKTRYICPAELSAAETRQCEDIAKKVCRILKGRGVPRVDMILDANGTPYVLEMNTLPGLTPTSLLPMAAKQAGMEFPDLVLEILQHARLDYQG
ncbi:MAG: D-alanine--D-alanine ligase [Nitrospinota bacterium]|nr:D-alanine--D-alanine ligase [Nitrospinota bacterium]